MYEKIEVEKCINVFFACFLYISSPEASDVT